MQLRFVALKGEDGRDDGLRTRHNMAWEVNTKVFHARAFHGLGHPLLFMLF
jgi:hypothetical protein